jgi:hypothetical protein
MQSHAPSTLVSPFDCNILLCPLTQIPVSHCGAFAGRRSRHPWKDHHLQEEEGASEIATPQIYEVEAPAYAVKANGKKASRRRDCSLLY